MNKCNQCGVFIDDNVNKCPLCSRNIGEATTEIQSKWYPVYHMTNMPPKANFVKKLLSFISIAVVSICILINLLTGIANPWFLYVAGPIIYFQILINNTIFSKTSVGSRILIQIAGVSGLALIIDLLSDFHRWSVNIVIPFLIIVGTSLITLIVLKKQMLWNEYVGYIITMIFLGFVPVLLYLSGVATQLWASAVSALYSFLTIIGMLLFANEKFKNEMTRRFHF